MLLPEKINTVTIYIRPALHASQKFAFFCNFRNRTVPCRGRARRRRAGVVAPYGKSNCGAFAGRRGRRPLHGAAQAGECRGRAPGPRGAVLHLPSSSAQTRLRKCRGVSSRERGRCILRVSASINISSRVSKGPQPFGGSFPHFWPFRNGAPGGNEAII